MTRSPRSIIAERAADPPVPAELGQPADERAGDDEPDEVAAGRAPEDRQAALALGEERQADRAPIAGTARRRQPAPEAERPADERGRRTSGR